MTMIRERLAIVFKKKVAAGWLLAPTVLLVISLLIMAASRCASAVELFPSPPYVFLGIDAELHDKAAICNPGATNPGAANLGAGVVLLGDRSWEINAQWTHHSCAFDDDNRVYDGAGLQLRWYPTLWRK